MAEPIAEARSVLEALVPRGCPFSAGSIPLSADECEWFLAGLKAGLLRFQTCIETCPRRARWKVSGPDEFLNPRGEPRHLFSAPHAPQPTFNREYLPHLAAHMRAILQFGYRGDRAALSEYRKFGRDLRAKLAGGSFEVDSLFYSASGHPILHIEAKSEPRQIARMARAIDGFRRLADLPGKVAKEVEYVLDLAPAYLWLVGPGTVDPEAHVWRVEVLDKRAWFERVPGIPSAPQALHSDRRTT